MHVFSKEQFKTKNQNLYLYVSNIYVTFMVELREYLREDEISPFAEWFNSLKAQAAAKVTTYLTRIENGNTSSLKSVGAGFMNAG